MVTDHLCSRPQENCIVVRFSGGQQAGHTVMLNGKKHVHSNYGSGTLRGKPSYFTEHCSIYPNTIYKEERAFNNHDIEPTLIIHPLAKLTTPFDVAYNRITEVKKNHGSCGLGIGATMHRHNSTGYKLFAIDTTNPVLLEQKLYQIYIYYKSIVSPEDSQAFEEIAQKELGLFNHALKCISFQIQDYGVLKRFTNIIFEGSQGVLLDMDHGIFPNVTYANTTSKNALAICSMLGVIPSMYYVTRCYQTRHGYGWMSDEKDLSLINSTEEINTYNGWQKDFRTGEFDYDLINYSLEIERIYTGYGVGKNLVVTCLDQRPHFQFQHRRIKFDFNHYLFSTSPDQKFMIAYSHQEMNGFVNGAHV